MRAAGAVLLLIASIGIVHAITYPTLEDAVKDTADLSVLTERMDAFPSFADQVMAANFVGTLFAPMDSALKPIEKFANMMLSNPSTATDMLGLFVVPGAPLKLSDLKDGMKLTTLNNQQVTVNIKQAADGQPIYYINQARIASGNIYAGQSIIHKMAGVIVAPSKQLLLNAALKTAGWSDNNPSATVNLSPNGPDQQPVEEPAAETPAAEQPAAETPADENPVPKTEDNTPVPSDSDITYEEQPATGDVDMGYEYGGDSESEPAQEAPVPSVPATDVETPATPATPAAPATPTPSAPAAQQPSVPVNVVPAPSTPQQQTDSSITLEAGKANTTTPSPATSTTTPAASPALIATKPTTTTTTATPAATTATTTTTSTTASTAATPAATSTGLPPAKTTSASSSVVVSAFAAIMPAVLALMMP